MGQLFSREMKSKVYKTLLKVNDRAFSLITLFSISASITMLDAYFNLTSKLNTLCYAFAALSVLVVTTILSSYSKWNSVFRIISATICVFLWLFVAKLSGVFNSNLLYSAIFAAVLFWSNINLLGVFLNARK